LSGIHGSQQQIDAYLDGELGDSEQASLLAHCDICETCRALLESRRALLETIRAARPRVKAPPGLRDQVTALLEIGGSTQRDRSSPNRRAVASPRRWPRAMVPFLSYALLLLVLAGVGASTFLARRQAQAARFVQMAVETHQRQLRGSLPIQFPSASAREVTAWFGSRLPFSLRLPTYQDDSGDRSRYQLVGASLTSFEGNTAAYIAYRMRDELISLVVVPANQVVASGGETTRAKSIVFHSARKDDLEAITWSVHHLTYALVSNLKLPRRRSCVVCHADPQSHALLQSALTHRSSSYHRNFSDVHWWSGQYAPAPLLQQ